MDHNLCEIVLNISQYDRERKYGANIPGQQPKTQFLQAWHYLKKIDLMGLEQVPMYYSIVGYHMSRL